MKFPSSNSRTAHTCRIQQWAQAWSESFRHEAKTQTSAELLAVEESKSRLNVELPEQISLNSAPAK